MTPRTTPFGPLITLMLCLAAALAGAACDSVIDPSQNQVEMLTGTVAVQNQVVHEFSASKNGEFEVRITTMSPNEDAQMGLQYGPRQGDSCLGAIQTNVFAQLNRTGLGGTINAGRYCLIVFDNGQLRAPQSYTLRVSHP